MKHTPPPALPRCGHVTVGSTAHALRQDVLRGLEEVALGLVGRSQPGPATQERGEEMMVINHNGRCL